MTLLNDFNFNFNFTYFRWKSQHKNHAHKSQSMRKLPDRGQRHTVKAGLTQKLMRPKKWSTDWRPRKTSFCKKGLNSSFLLYTHTHIYTEIHTHKCTRTIRAHICTNTHAYTHTPTHTHTHINQFFLYHEMPLTSSCTSTSKDFSTSFMFNLSRSVICQITSLLFPWNPDWHLN